MWKVARIQAELGPIEEEEEALEEERVTAGNVPPVPMLSTKERMEQLRKARQHSKTRSNLEQHPTEEPSQRRKSTPPWLLPTPRSKK